MAGQRWIAHLDMDAFYASVELLRYPVLRGHPVVIGGRRISTGDDARQSGFARLRDYLGRGVVTTATYEARAFGVHSGMGLMRAGRLAPTAILLPADFAEYSRVSRLFKSAVRAIAPHIEDRGIDEIYVDLTSQVSGLSGTADTVSAELLARKLKLAVRETTGLTCSVGLTPNKLLSKIASELEKPDGLTRLGFDDLAGRIWPLPVERINGVGPKAATKLKHLGLASIGQLAAADRQMLIREFGTSYGNWLHASANGHDDRPVVTSAEPRSISRETTFERDLDARGDRGELGAVFSGLCRQVCDDLRRKGYQGRTIGIKLRFDDFRTVTRDQSLGAPTDDEATIRRTAGACIRRVSLTRRIRLLGVRIGSLCRAGEPFPVDSARDKQRDRHTLPLFEG